MERVPGVEKHPYVYMYICLYMSIGIKTTEKLMYRITCGGFLSHVFFPQITHEKIGFSMKTIQLLGVHPLYETPILHHIPSGKLT